MKPTPTSCARAQLAAGVRLMTDQSPADSKHPRTGKLAGSMALSRTSAKLRRAMRAGATIAFCATFGAATFVAGVFIHAMGTVPMEQWSGLINVALLFSVAGALFGTILALD